MVGGSLRVLQLLPPLTLVAMILLKVVLNTQQPNHERKNVKLLSAKKRKLVQHDISDDYQTNNQIL
jgi:hypothetical protein